jgi:hypothetical protein
MVKLIRMIADKEKSNKIISNTFNPSFTIEPNSRIALQSVNANLLRTANDMFTITTFNDALNIDGFDVTLTPDDYDAGTFVNMIQGAIQLNGASTLAAGVNLDVLYKSDTITFEKYECPLLTADWAEWNAVQGTPDLTTDGIFDADGSTDEIQVISLRNIPNASFSMSGKITTVAPFVFGLFDGMNVDDYVAIQVNGANQYVIYSPDGLGGAVTTNTGITALTNDVVSIVRVRNVITYTYGANSSTTTITEADLDTMIEETTILTISAPAGSTAVVQNMKFTTVDDRSSLRNLKTKRTTLTIVFGSDSLAKYCGFKTLNPPPGSGDPAEVAAGGPLRGDPVAPGILVCIDPFILESYDGDQRKLITNPSRPKGQSNILYVLQSTDPDLVQQETFPIPLGIRNNATMQINELQVTFRDQSNGNILEFNGEPSVVLVIYGPGE